MSSCLGNCAWSNTSTDMCPLGPINITRYQTDLDCEVPCGVGVTCTEERCNNSKDCVAECQTCEDLGFSDPCLALINETFGKI